MWNRNASIDNFNQLLERLRTKDPSLTTAYVGARNFTEVCTIMDLLKGNTSLTTLSFEHQYLYMFGGEQEKSEILSFCQGLAAFLKNNTTIRELNVHDVCKHPRAMEILAPALATSQLRSLGFNNNDALTKDGAGALQWALPRSQLRTLTLAGTQLNCEALALLAGACADPASKLEALDISRQAAPKRATPSTSNMSDFENPRLQYRIALLLKNIISIPTLRHLTLRQTALNAATFEGFASAIKSSGLVFLDLSDNYLGDPGFQILAKALIGSQVAELHLANNNICSEVEANKKQSDATANDEVKEIVETNAIQSVSRPQLETSQRALANFVRSHKPLKTLNLANNGILDQGFEVLASALPESQLSSLSLQADAVPGPEHMFFTGILALLEALPRTQLVVLNINRTQCKHKEHPDTIVSLLKINSAQAKRLQKSDSLQMQAINAYVKSVLNAPSSRDGRVSFTPKNFGDPLLNICQVLAFAEVLTENKKLQELWLKDPWPNGSWPRETMIILAPALRTSQIQVLDYPEELSHWETRVLAEVLPKMQLRTLNVRLQGAYLETFAMGFQLTRVENLDLSSSNLYPKDPNYSASPKDDPEQERGIGSALCSIIANPHLRQLKLNDCGLTATSVITFTPAFNGSRLTSLDLSCNRLGNAGFQALAQGLLESQVTDLNLANNNICNEVETTQTHSESSAKTEGKEAAEAETTQAEDRSRLNAAQQALANFVRNHKTLTKLNLAENGIVDRGVIALASALIESSITWLNLRKLGSYNRFNPGARFGNGITTQGMRSLCQAIPNTKLTHIDYEHDYQDRDPYSELSNEFDRLLRGNLAKARTVSPLSQMIADNKTAAEPITPAYVATTTAVSSSTSAIASTPATITAAQTRPRTQTLTLSHLIESIRLRSSFPDADVINSLPASAAAAAVPSAAPAAVPAPAPAIVLAAPPTAASSASQQRIPGPGNQRTVSAGKPVMRSVGNNKPGARTQPRPAEKKSQGKEQQRPRWR